MKRVGIYLRVSTDSQTTENQRRELEAVATRSGWQVINFYEDAGISGAKGRDKRSAAEGRRPSTAPSSPISFETACIRSDPFNAREVGAATAGYWMAQGAGLSGAPPSNKQ